MVISNEGNLLPKMGLLTSSSIKQQSIKNGVPNNKLLTDYIKKNRTTVITSPKMN